ncbi:MAG: thiamine-monophosphate kinase [Bradymonadia bacterium]|jgi:thiamine-monophosphate kinase
MTENAVASTGDFVRVHRRPQLPPFDPVLARAARCNAAMDISDGLAVDLRRFCDASGCGALIRLPLPGRAELLMLDFLSPANVDEFQLKGGEDFVALVAGPCCPGPEFVEIGTVCEPHLGLTVIGPDGSRQCLPDAGFAHFS